MTKVQLSTAAALLVVGALAVCSPAPAAAPVQPIGDTSAVAETEPVASTGDAADDPAIWRDPQDPSRSVVIGNDKGGALEVYDLDGRRLQRLTGGFYGNVDTRPAVATGTGAVDLVAVWRAGVRLFAMDPTTRLLRTVTDSTTASIPLPITAEGLCLYRSPVNGDTHVFANDRAGRMVQLRLDDTDGDGLLGGTVVREWDTGGETEGCVADDDRGVMYVSEEDVGIWRYGAEPADSTADRTLVDTVVGLGGRIRPDAEGLTIVYQPGGEGYLIASSQAASDSLNSYLVYDRVPGNAFLSEFRVVGGDQADGCGRTDGIDALAADLGPRFPRGVFICQDNANTAPAPGNQNFKLVPLERVVTLTGGPTSPTAPVAVLDVQCTALSCDFSGTRSSDADGQVTGWAWDLGDGATAEGSTVRHTYATSGDYILTLTVTDASGTTATTSRAISVSDAPTPPSFVDRVMLNANTTTHRVTVPAGVRAGDALLLLMGTNNTATIGQPAGVTGWRQLGSVSMSGGRSTAWLAVAQAGDTGRGVTVRTATTAKAHLVLLAYRGTSPQAPLAQFAGVADASGRTAHTSPSAQAPSGALVVSWWTHKDSTTALLTPPPGVTTRATGTQSGSGNVKGLVVDHLAPAGTTGGLTATASAAGIASMWTFVLAP